MTKAKTPLNGTQLDSLINITSKVANGELSYESAKAILIITMGFDSADAEKILNNGKQVKEKKEEKTNA